MTDHPDLPLPDRLALERTRLANERTLLAYVRTALGIVVAGYALVRLTPGEVALRVGVGLSVAGAVVGLVGMWRYGRVGRRVAGAVGRATVTGGI
ncbi:MAG: DUF202 domain-containing protein [Gemmatimonadetes bacterium]|nr:DUF202 domain-containing protein [Gemmatimonadota bacterium]